MAFEAPKIEQLEKDPFLSEFSTIHEFEEALKAKYSVSFTNTERVSNGDNEIVIGLGDDHMYYLISQTQGKVIFVQSEDTWEAALALAKSLLQAQS